MTSFLRSKDICVYLIQRAFRLLLIDLECGGNVSQHNLCNTYCFRLDVPLIESIVLPHSACCKRGLIQDPLHRKCVGCMCLGLDDDVFYVSSLNTKMR